MNRALAVAFSIILVVSAIGLVGAQENLNTLDDFESDDFVVESDDWNDWQGEPTDWENVITINDQDPINGSFDVSYDTPASGAWQNRRITTDTNSSAANRTSELWFWVNVTDIVGESGDGLAFRLFNQQDQVIVQIVFRPNGDVDINGTTQGTYTNGVDHEVRIYDIDYADNTTRVSISGTSIDVQVDFANPSDQTGAFQIGNTQNEVDDDIDAQIDNIRWSESPIREVSIESKGFVSHGESIPYKVFEGDNDITDQATVTSSDPSILSVDATNQTLDATEDESVNQVVTITAEFEGSEATQDVFVGNKTLNNIGDLPPATWPIAIIGQPGDTTGSSGTWPGAIQLQWLFVCLSLGAIVSWRSVNPFMGMGTVEAMLLFGWTINWISDGMLIASIIFLVYASLSLTDIASGNLGHR